MRQVICWFVYIGKNPRFTALDSNLHTRLAIVTENELGLAFPPRNLPKKFRPDPSTFYLVIVVTKQTDRQTSRQLVRQTNAGDYIIPRGSFRGDNKRFTFLKHGVCTANSLSGNTINDTDQHYGQTRNRYIFVDFNVICVWNFYSSC